jgi:hypothetical protein
VASDGLSRVRRGVIAFGEPTMPEPRTAIVNPTEVARFLWRAASSMATNINLDFKLQSTQTAALKILRFGGSGTFVAVPTPNEASAARMANEFYKLFCLRFSEACARGPRAMQNYLDEKLAQTEHALASIQFKFAAADEVNSEVLGEIKSAINTCQRIKTGAELAFLYFGTFGGAPIATGVLSWQANTALGVGLTMATEVASTLGEVETADVLTFTCDSLVAVAKGLGNVPTQSNIASNVSGGLGNKAADLGDQAAARTKDLLEQMEKQNGTAITNQLARVKNYLAQQKIATSDIGEKTVTMTGQQVRNIEAGADKITKAMQAELAADAGYAAGQRLAFCVKGVSFVVGLFFMRENIYKAWIGQTNWEDEQRLKAARR